ncbi:acyl-CoA oxidase [Tieghemostelium lacteum]|uniref:Acyl-coenzyme A oxidase n=1 Tax=Tieghemostelium lacteum TaxID=361077 RepID=A0A151ZD16_TIELA|nr:acyl-CoA oxidase [Tieghemostelium lacteum]|eukprot:KYQ91846.1 acyl-CoA oxidase [Tieghemostelium lacteum]
MYHLRIENIKNHLTANENEVSKVIGIDKINIKDLKELIDSPEAQVYKDECRKFLQKEPSFTTNFYNLDPINYKELVLKQISSIAKNGIVRFTDVRDNVYRLTSAFEIFSMYNNNITTKMGVQYTLFGGTITLLGTQRHEKYIAPADVLQIAGCFAMTEIGHGSNVRGIETTATYKKSTQEFIINSPTPTSQKFWIGGAGLHAHYATVFAKLIIDSKDYGVHAFVVPIRDTNSNQILPGITIKDCGQKLGLNGIDNGQIKFDQVHIPRENLLNKFSDVAADGTYKSAFTSPIKNFAATMAPFVVGRLGISKVNSGASKSALAIAIRFSHVRKQFGPTENNELPIITLSSQRQRLIVPLSKTIVLDLFQQKLAKDFTLEKVPSTIHAQCSGVKALYSWECIKTLQVCREACGGQGYRASNRISEFKSDVDITATYEGDNTVLMQQVAKFLLAQKPQTNLPLVRLVKPADLFNLPKILDLFRYRTELKVDQLRGLLKSSSEKNAYLAYNQLIPWGQSAANAYMETIILENTMQFIKKKLVQPLPHFCYIDTLSKIQDDLAWFISNQFISVELANSIPFILMDLCNQLTPHLLDIVEAFDIPKKALPVEDLISDLF